MKEWLEVFEKPIIDSDLDESQSLHSFGNTIIKSYNDSIQDDFKFDIAIIGVLEDRHAYNNSGCSKGADAVRSCFYKLMNKYEELKIVDLGNIKRGNTVEDTYFVTSEIIKSLLEKNVFPIVLGGSNDLAYSNYLAYEKKGQIINIASIDSRIDISSPEKEFNSSSYLNRIILRQPNFLFNYSNIGHQSYFVDNEKSELMKQLFFDCYRLGDIREEIEESEALVRNADMLSIDISAVRQSEAPGNYNSSPNGFYGEEICKICRYAGMSDKLSSAGFYEINPVIDRNNQTAHLVAQMIWFLIEGFVNRKNDNPRLNKEEFIIYHVINKQLDLEINFYRSKKSERWWMEVPYDSEKDSRIKRHFLVACSQKDYQTAMKDELPDRWWQTYQKIM